MVGTQLWKICLLFYLGLLFPSPLSSLSCSIVASLPVVSPWCGVLCVEGSSGWVTFKSSQQLDCCGLFKPCHEPLTLPGFGLGSFSHCLGTMVIWVFPFLRSSLCFLPHRRWYCPSWWFLLVSSDFVVCELHSLLVLCECCPKGFDLALYSSYSALLLCGDLGRSKIVLPLPPPFYQHLLRIIF